MMNFHLEYENTTYSLEEAIYLAVVREKDKRTTDVLQAFNYKAGRAAMQLQCPPAG